MTEQQFEAIGKIMDTFDFAQVHKAMVALDWHWGNLEGGLGIPDEVELRSEARQLLTRAIKEKMSIATGGFWVKYQEDEENEWIDLKFVVEQWDETITKKDLVK